jgi:hypothetical protein
VNEGGGLRYVSDIPAGNRNRKVWRRLGGTLMAKLLWIMELVTSVVVVPITLEQGLSTVYGLHSKVDLGSCPKSFRKEINGFYELLKKRHALSSIFTT